MPPSRRRPAVTGAALAALLAATGLTGCANEPEAGTVTVLNSATDTHEHEQNQKYFDRCARPLGVKVKQTSVPADQVSAKALRMASSHSLTDILELDGSEVAQFADTGGLLPLAETGVDVSGLSKSAVSMGSFRGTQYGIARSVNSLALIYNVDLLKKAGVRPPATWDELKSTARKLTRGKTFGMAFSATPDADGVYQFLPFFWTGDGDEARLDDGKGAPALQLWKDLVTGRSASSAVVTWNQQDVNDQFIAGRAAMMINGPWQVPVLSAQKNLHWAVAQIPVPERGQAAQPPIGGTVMTLPRTEHKDRQDTAAKILNCLNERKNQVAWGESVNNVPTRTAAAKQYKKQNPKLAAFADEVATARSRTARVGARWPVVQDALSGAFQSVLTGRAEPRTALKQAQNRATSGG
ncbi:extracellular solute-binding protein [Streptomyces tsukubensis]|uniref:ABC transporter substrate-binding protein n=1 Tax=Streptomyces tsukubensis TaxID=83656 RepID=A0A1V4AGX2_9ACTN|nr:extracellular solute-binding protein [Streptomyces tsukubensis]OON82925.1 ABC transporter substrate-binding protein [Streptomyces tsukubensis]QFR91891.1 extracellular solute-binding protein [Streptomyces tsukubensis]